MESYPAIPLEVEMAVALPDEPGEQWDVLFQNGPPRVEGLVATALGRPPVLLCATPAYLRAHEALKQPGDLAHHAILVPGQQVTELRLHRGHTQAQVSLTPRLIVTDPAVVHAATASGAGIGVLPEFLCRVGLSMNKLEHVLPEWRVEDLLELYAVTDLRRASSPAVKALIDFFVANMVPVLGRG
jgi:DNA-binding transcriptional LysR family regulator